MDKRYETDKKTDYKVKDRGDLRKVTTKMLKRSEGNTQMGIKLVHPERGDSDRKLLINKTEQNTLNTDAKKLIDKSLKKIIYGTAEKDSTQKKNYDVDEYGKSYPELRKRIRDRYTVKLNNPVFKSDHLSVHMNKKDDCSTAWLKAEDKSVPKTQLPEETTKTKEKLNDSPAPSIKPDLDKKPEKNPAKPDKITKHERTSKSPKIRKPIVKTIMSNGGRMRVFKAVTFVDQTHNSPPTPLEIKIPSDLKKKQKVSKYTETSSLKIKPKATVSKTSLNKEKDKMAAVRKKIERKLDKKFRHGVPSTNLVAETASPPTEVARWAPASIDHHTKPYYEAWVDTTLAAISKRSHKDRLNSSLLRSFRRVLAERPSSPELCYANYTDEKYTGRIKVTQR